MMKSEEGNGLGKGEQGPYIGDADRGIPVQGQLGGA